MRSAHWIHLETLPPCAFIADPMKFAMMRPAQRYSEFIADPAAQRAGLREPNMMGVARRTSANQTRLGFHEFQVLFISQPPCFSGDRSPHPAIVNGD